MIRSAFIPTSMAPPPSSTSSPTGLPPSLAARPPSLPCSCRCPPPRRHALTGSLTCADAALAVGRAPTAVHRALLPRPPPHARAAFIPMPLATYPVVARPLLLYVLALHSSFATGIHLPHASVVVLQPCHILLASTSAPPLASSAFSIVTVQLCRNLPTSSRHHPTSPAASSVVTV
jgi:hypothetical protein